MASSATHVGGMEHSALVVQGGQRTNKAPRDASFTSVSVMVSVNRVHGGCMTALAPVERLENVWLL